LCRGLVRCALVCRYHRRGPQRERRPADAL